jgi:hypothetical protein
VEFFAAGHHVEDELEAARAGLGFFGGLEAIDDGVNVGAIERIKKSLRAFVLFKCSEKIGGRGGVAWGIVSGFPAPISFGGGDGGETGGGHLAGLDEAFSVLGIQFRPAATSATRNKFLKPRLLVVRLGLAINPAEAERLIEGIGSSDGGFAGPFFEKAQPKAVGPGVIFLEPSAEGGGGFEFEWYWGDHDGAISLNYLRGICAKTLKH